MLLRPEVKANIHMKVALYKIKESDRNDNLDWTKHRMRTIWGCIKCDFEENARMRSRDTASDERIAAAGCTPTLYCY